MSIRYEVFHPDVSVVVDFYCDVLGFSLRTDRRAEVPQYAVVTRGDAYVGCSQMDGGSLHDRRPPEGSEIVLTVGDLDAVYARVKAARWPIADELAKRPWGMADFRIFDPTGQYLRVTERVDAAAGRSVH